MGQIWGRCPYVLAYVLPIHFFQFRWNFLCNIRKIVSNNYPLKNMLFPVFGHFLAVKWAWLPHDPRLVLRNSIKKLYRWANRYLKIMFSKFSGLKPRSLIFRLWSLQNSSYKTSVWKCLRNPVYHLIFHMFTFIALLNLVVSNAFTI